MWLYTFTVIHECDIQLVGACVCVCVCLEGFREMVKIFSYPPFHCSKSKYYHTFLSTQLYKYDLPFSMTKSCLSYLYVYMSITSHMKKILTFMSYWLTSCFCMAFYFPTCFCICYVFGPKSQSCSQLSPSPFLCRGNKLKGDVELLGSNVAVRTMDAFHSFPSERGPRRTPAVYAEAERWGQDKADGKEAVGCRESELTVGRAELRAGGSTRYDGRAEKQPAGRAWGRKRNEGDGSGKMWAWQPSRCDPSSEPRPVCAHEGVCREGPGKPSWRPTRGAGRGRLSREPRAEVLGEPGSEQRKERGHVMRGNLCSNG